MESDTPRTDALREADGLRRLIVAEELERELNATKAQLVSKTDELAAMKQQRDGYLEGNRQTLRALSEANEIAARYKRERDEARRDYCESMSARFAAVGKKVSVEEFAAQRGWDCYAQEGGGS